MSFSVAVKEEICKAELRAPCCALAASYGVACFGRYFDRKGVVLHTEREFIARWAQMVFSRAGIHGQVIGKSRENSRIYEFSVKEPYEVEKLLATFGHTGDETAIRLHRENLECEHCSRVFIAAAFLCCGTVVNPEKGYNLEFVSPRFRLAGDLEQLLASQGYTPGRTVRKGANVVYLRSSSQIEDILAAMGAGKYAMELMNLKIYRGVRNTANRITNCETANIDKTIAANILALESIRFLRQRGLLDSLPEALRQAAALRERNPDLSLAQLAEISPSPVSKSGLSHRYRRLAQLAEKHGMKA